MRERLFVVVFALLLTCSAIAQIPEAQHVFVVVEHGHSYTSVVNSPSMPYLNQMASQYGLATQYYANTHPAIGNYFTMTTGQVISNNDSFTGTLLQDNIVRHLLQAGKTWKSYAESLPSPGYTGGDKYPYLKRQNPFAYFSDVVNSNEKQNLVPLTQLVTDLRNGTVPNLSFIVPNAQNSMRDCPAGMSTCSDAQKLSNADKWLKTVVPAIMASDVFQKNGLLVVLFDESASTDTVNGGGRVAAVVAGPNVKRGYKSTTFYSHKNLLKTVLQALGVNTAPAAVSTSVAMKDMFASPATTTTTSATTSALAVTAMATSAATAGVTVTSPTPGSTVTSPVRFAASANGGSYPITAMKIYVDYVAQYSINAASLSTSLSLSAGSHSITVQAWNSAGTVYKNSFTITVSSATSSSTTSPYNLYVSTSGSDSNDGSSARPFRTISKAASVVVPGTTVHVMPGVYVERVNITRSGTASSRIVFKSETKWGAKVQTTSAQGYYHIGVNANYVDIVNFDVSGTNTSTAGIGIALFGSYNRAIGNHVYKLITGDCSGRGGLVGITAPWTGQTTAKRVYNEIIGNVIHDIHCTTFPGPKGGTGIYIGDQHNTAKNNLVYTVGGYGIESNHLTGWNTIANNTIGNVPNTYGNAGIMMSVGPSSEGYTITSDYNVVANNIVVDSYIGIAAYYGDGNRLGTHNVWSNNLTYNNKANTSCKSGGFCPSDPAALHSNPLFVSKSYSTSNSGNFRLQSSSPAVNRATMTYSPSNDLDLVARPQLGNPDMGSYEYH